MIKRLLLVILSSCKLLIVSDLWLWHPKMRHPIAHLCRSHMFLRLYYFCLCSIRRFMMTFSTPWVTQDRTTTLRSSYSHLHCLLCQPKGTHSPMWRLGMPASLKGYILPLIQPFSSGGRITSTSPFSETPILQPFWHHMTLVYKGKQKMV